MQNPQGDYSGGMEVQDSGQINPALVRPDIGYAANPLLVELARSEILLQEIRRDVECVVTVRPAAGNLIHRVKFRSRLTLSLWVLTTQIASCRIKRPTRQCPTCNPNSFSPSVIRGASVAALACSALIADVRKKHHVTPLPV